MAQPRYHAYLTPQSRGVITLPADLRHRLGLDEPGAQLELTERADGVIEMRAALPVPATERWFWSDRWQAGERAVDEHVAAGRVTRHDSAEEFLATLDES